MRTTARPGIDPARLFFDALSRYDLAPEHLARFAATLSEGRPTAWRARANRAGLALHEAARLTGEAAFSLNLGRQIRLSQFGAIGFAAMSCDNLRDALGLMVRYHPLLDMVPPVELTRGCEHSKLTATAHTLPQETLQPLIEAIFASLAAAGRELLGRPITEVVIHVSYPAPEHADCYGEYLSAPTEFDHSACEIILPNALLDQSIRSANPAGHVVFSQQCEDMLRTLNRVENLSAAVRRIILRAERTRRDLAWVADELAMSERTLRRRLEAEGASFRAIRDEVRDVLAKRYLSSTTLTIAEIAELLDYTEAASFRRAFKRSNGVTPQIYRARSGSGN